MRQIADLHTHTTYSDGTLTPAELLQKAAQRGVKALAITDHDTADACREAMPLAEELGMDFIGGIEMSVFDAKSDEPQECHILGYCIDTNHRFITQYAHYCRAKRLERAERIVGKLRKLGVALPFEDVLRQAGTGVVGRQHIALALQSGGHTRSTKEAFERYLADDAPACLPKWHFPIEEALELIHGAGGIGVLAHPARFFSGQRLVKMVRAGLDGVEVFHPSHDAALNRHYEQFAKAYRLYVSGGSDYHGGRYMDEVNFGAIGLPYERFASQALPQAPSPGQKFWRFFALRFANPEPPQAIENRENAGTGKKKRRKRSKKS